MVIPKRKTLDYIMIVRLSFHIILSISAVRLG